MRRNHDGIIQADGDRKSQIGEREHSELRARVSILLRVQESERPAEGAESHASYHALLDYASDVGCFVVGKEG